ncbi:hypothetical protein VitviT2T_025795 [Vitis vinifera]|uniref:Exonuclease 1 n=2 Tax=Vitis vinifera TaxID=29760 RepID=A0ABY9DJX9_VITVI|nr:exonuclease 1 isoform X1 [Vitis vinifera]WKA08033.1 hypothetical protein VitviT2T_025795 [Vitis vinifera]|eukprot:XP_010663661.1 PREDICTED: exonuclease 1 isoform X1 [Vitis vinifera]
MGIKDLLRYMKPFIEPIHIKKYAGKRVGIDAYSWLHKGAYSCSMEICLNSKGDKKSRYLQYFMHRIDLLRHYKITPVVVFDGGNIPCKATTEQERYRKRKSYCDLAMAKLKEGDVTGASELFQRAVTITPSMAHQLIQILRTENIEFVVAPYEADAQLAYLSNLEADKGGIAAVITEDSDLMAYGCRAIIFKMDRYGNGEEMVLDRVFDSVARAPSFQNFDKELFTGMCVLAGCDFLPSVPGIGIARAYSMVAKYRNLDRVLSVLKFEKRNQMPEDYTKSFREAVAVFQHARIYDADTKRVQHMKPLTDDLLQSLDGELDFLGPEIPPSIATAIAEGNLDPVTMEAFDHFSSHESQPEPTVTQTSNEIVKPEATAQSTEESCFTIFSSHETREERVTASTVMEQRPVIEETKYLNEAVALQKIMFPSEVHGMLENKITQDETPLEIPDNNPFKKRKLNEIYLDQIPSITEQISVVVDVDNSDIMCVTLESQESVDSKPNKVADRKAISKNEKRKRSDCKSSESKKNSILNFFSRV